MNIETYFQVVEGNGMEPSSRSRTVLEMYFV